MESSDAERRGPPIRRAQIPGLLIFGLLIGVGLIINYVRSDFMEGIQILFFSKPPTTGYDSAEAVMKAYVRATIKEDAEVLWRRVYSQSYLAEAGITGPEKIPFDKTPAIDISWRWTATEHENDKAIKVFTVSITGGSTRTVKDFRLSETVSGWKIVAIR